jgi:hypothetical protein
LGQDDGRQDQAAKHKQMHSSFATVFGKLIFRDLSKHRRATEAFLARLDAENTVFIGDAYIYTSANT